MVKRCGRSSFPQLLKECRRPSSLTGASSSSCRLRRAPVSSRRDSVGLVQQPQDVEQRLEPARRPQLERRPKRQLRGKVVVGVGAAAVVRPPALRGNTWRWH